VPAHVLALTSTPGTQWTSDPACRWVDLLWRDGPDGSCTRPGTVSLFVVSATFAVVRRGPMRTSGLVAFGAVALVALLSMTGCTRNAEAFESFQLLNKERTARGLAEVTLDDQLVTKAHEWAAVMAGSGVRHSRVTDGAGDNWTILAENVGRAQTVAEMNRLFMASPVHSSIILDRRMTRVGTGVAVANGQVFVVQVFSG
jgi:uncharacterized protein YkwD